VGQFDRFHNDLPERLFNCFSFFSVRFFRASSVIRHSQLPPMVDGILNRVSSPVPSRSCMGMMERYECEGNTPLIHPSVGPSSSVRFRYAAAFSYVFPSADSSQPRIVCVSWFPV